MSTRSIISVQLDDGSIKSTYCHFDGYIQGVGNALFNRIKTQDAAIKLIEGGWLRSFETTGGADYYRDCSYITFKDFEEYSKYIFDCIDYFYLFTNNEWSVCKSHKHLNSFATLSSIINKE